MTAQIAVLEYVESPTIKDVRRYIADAAALKTAKACHKFIFDFLTMESLEFCDIYGMEFLGRMSDPADEVLASWLKGQGIEVTE
jgi:hypothetical protein